MFFSVADVSSMPGFASQARQMPSSQKYLPRSHLASISPSSTGRTAFGDGYHACTSPLNPFQWVGQGLCHFVLVDIVIPNVRVARFIEIKSYVQANNPPFSPNDRRSPLAGEM